MRRGQVRDVPSHRGPAPSQARPSDAGPDVLGEAHPGAGDRRGFSDHSPGHRDSKPGDATEDRGDEGWGSAWL